MVAEEFTELLKNPTLLKNYSLDELLLLSEQYPFSQVIYPLIVKKAQMLNEGDFESYLHRAAINVPDRNKLFHFIHSVTLNGEKEHGVHEEAVEEIVNEVVPFEHEIETPVTEIIKPEIVYQKPEAETIVEVVRKEKKEKKKVKAEKPEKKQKAVKEVSRKKKKIKPQAEIPVTEAGQPKAKKIQKNPKTEIPASDTHTFSEWLKLLQGERKAVSKFSGVKKAESDFPAKQQEEEFTLRLPTDLPEPAIRATRKIETTPEEEEAMSLRAQESVKQTDENITETLAKVFEMQQKYDKAISAYETLILKYPDKNAYFARKIKSLKGKL